MGKYVTRGTCYIVVCLLGNLTGKCKKIVVNKTLRKHSDKRIKKTQKQPALLSLLQCKERVCVYLHESCTLKKWNTCASLIFLVLNLGALAAVMVQFLFCFVFEYM